MQPFFYSMSYVLFNSIYQKSQRGMLLGGSGLNGSRKNTTDNINIKDLMS